MCIEVASILTLTLIPQVLNPVEVAYITFHFACCGYENDVIVFLIGLAIERTPAGVNHTPWRDLWFTASKVAARTDFH